MPFANKSNEMHANQDQPKHQMVDIPIRPPCCAVLINSKNNFGKIQDRCKTKSDQHGRSKFYNKKCIFFSIVSFTLLTIILLRLAFLILFVSQNNSACVQPESRMEQKIRQNYLLARLIAKKQIDEDSAFNDKTELANQITQTTERDTFPTMNERDTRLKREISRIRRGCEMNAERCENLVHTMENYLKILKNNVLSDPKNPISGNISDILMCLRCKNLKNSNNENKFNEDPTPQLQYQYFTNDHVQQNSLNDSDITAIKLLNNVKEAKRTEINRQTEAARIQTTVIDSLINDISQDSVNQSLKNIGTSKTTTISIDRTNYNDNQHIHTDTTDINNSSMTSLNDEQPDVNLITIDSRTMRIQKINESNFSTDQPINADQQIESKDTTTSKMVTLQFDTTASSSRTQYTVDDAISKGTIDYSMGSTEMNTQYPANLTKQIAENVTSMSAGYDVTGIDSDRTVHPSVQPSSEGHPENQSAVTINVSESTEDHSVLTSNDRFETENSSEPIQVTSESIKYFPQLQILRTMLHPVCIFDYSSSQSSNTPPAFFYRSDLSDSFDTQNRELPVQKSVYQGSPSNYMQANTMQFIPGFGYAGNLPQAQSAEQDIDYMGSITSNVSPITFNQQPTTRTSYFCGYMALPALHFSPISSMLQSGRSFVDNSLPKVKSSLPEEAQKLSQKNWNVMSQDSSTYKCPQNHYQCDNLFCIPDINRCDGHANCFDVSDERNCPCRDRILQDQICDGYFDCPHGEDELGCFGCPAEFFSCNYNSNNVLMWNNCVPLSQRCDGIKQCFNGKDEMDCTILSESYISPRDISTVGYTQGYLHKNVQGQWYPVCSITPSWATDACLAEIGQPLTAMPEIQFVRVPENVFQDPYIKEDDGQIELTSCSGMAIFVKCPPLPCGIKTVLYQDSFRDAMTNNYLYKRQTKEHSYKFNKLYEETLGLLNVKYSGYEKKEQNQNDTLVGAQSRVVGGRASQPKAWPFLVAIYKDGRFYCGGVILSEIHVLTASHCLDGFEKHYYEVQAGTLKRFSFSPTAQLRKAKFVIRHPNYESKNIQNDISLIILDKPFLFNRWIRQVCLPSPSIIGPNWNIEPLPLSMCIAIGWGALRENGPNSDYLQEVEVPILPNCNHLPDQNNATICAGYPEGGQDTCQGDSGGPLMCRNRNFNSQWYVAGLISHGDGCARPNEPGVYMKISYFLDWIQQTSNMLDNVTLFHKSKKPLANCPTFSCDDGKCLAIEQRCDRIIDCLNGEDEMQCYLFEMPSFISNINNNKYRQSNFNNEIVKSQDKISDNNIKNQMSTERGPVFTSYNYFYKTQAAINKNTWMNAITPNSTSVRSTFTCKRLLQTITINKRCDKHLDCEDATDEKDCTCRDYLSHLQPTAICDGHLDCNDKTDEKDCGICGDDKFYCSRSEGCIPITSRCDGNFDCPLSEDELDCLALTDGEYVNVDSDNQSVLNLEGLLSRYENGTWHVQCLEAEILDNNNATSIIGRNLCEYLGFANLQSTDKVVVKKTMLETRFLQRWDNITSYEPSPEYVAASDEEDETTCTTLKIRCKQVLSSSVDSHLIVDPRTGNRTYLWPWLAAIFVEGRYLCSALLLEQDWLLSSPNCTNNIKLSVNYTTALLGQSRSYLYVDGPHQQISVVDEIRNMKTLNISLLHLKTAMNITRYVKPLFLEKKIYPPTKNDLCVAVGTDKEHVTRSMFLQPVLENCNNCYRCFVKMSGFECPVNETSLDWSGIVFCRSEKGWYPSGIFYDDLCSFQDIRNLTSIDYIHAFVMHALDSNPISEPTCDGVRCNLGQCVPWSQVCDDIVDCRDGSDEKEEICIRKMQQSKNSSSNKLKKCAKSELRCKNGECISKSEFCDAKVDCSDGTDEPIICTCAEYLSLTIPERLCDGVRHCLDKTDESPEMCQQCTQTSFKCNAKSDNVTCISNDFVCDGDNDCPNGEDEMECKKIKTLKDNRPGTGEVIQRSYGLWHSQCFSSPVTSQEEAKIVCQNLGYTNGSIDSNESNNQFLSEPVIPARDDFYMVRLNLDTWITMRNDKPLVTLVRPTESCYRLFVTCN